MRSKGPFLLFLTGLAVLSGYLLSKASLIGRTGINIFYKEYKFLKTWWKGGLAVLSVLLLLFFIQGLLQQRWTRKKAAFAHSIAIILALLGLYLTYYDFRHTLTHRLLGERFHLGAYLFWLGWISISIYFLVQKPRLQPIPTNTEML